METPAPVKPAVEIGRPKEPLPPSPFTYKRVSTPTEH